MVKKLLKHEYIYYIRTFGLFLPIVLVIGVFTRVARCFDQSSVINRIMISSSTVMLVVSCAAVLILSAVIGIVRFYKNMYTSEGYLTFTLPVTNTAHIFVKLLAAVTFQAACIVVVAAAGAIALSGQALADVWNGFAKVMTAIFRGVGTGHAIGFIVEWVILVILSAVTNMLLFYACITVGQTAKKNRIIKAIGAYFVYYVVTQVVSTVFTIIMAFLDLTGDLLGIVQWIVYRPMAAAHTGFIGMILLTAGQAVLFWFVTHRIMTTKLNLE